MNTSMHTMIVRTKLQVKFTSEFLGSQKEERSSIHYSYQKGEHVLLPPRETKFFLSRIPQVFFKWTVTLWSWVTELTTSPILGSWARATLFSKSSCIIPLSDRVLWGHGWGGEVWKGPCVQFTEAIYAHNFLKPCLLLRSQI